jgi:hypothetical protein
MKKREGVKSNSAQGAYQIATYYGNSVHQALQELFPNIGIDKSKFITGNYLLLFFFH